MDLFWENSGWESEDKHLMALRSAPFRRAFPSIDTKTGPALFILRGPRQVGKSSWLKKILLEYGEPRRAFYLSCENVENYHELSTILKSIRTTRSLILLDEVSFVKEWTRAVKHEIDSGYRGVLIVTGSHAGELRQGADLMPGRFGYGQELVLRPMDFAEFAANRLSTGWPKLERAELLKLYFQIGGMPTALAESGPRAKIPQKAFDTYERWLVGDATRLGKNKAFLEGLLAQLAVCTATPISLQTLAKKTEIASHHTVQNYIHFLEDSFALRTCYALDSNSGASRFRKDKKFYFTDPIIFWIAIRMGGLPVPNEWEAHVAEMVGYEALARRAELSRERLGYFASSSGEVDYFSPQRWAIELKWSEVAHNISKAYHKLVLPQKFVWTKSNFLEEWPQQL
jgi:predicted AAA+ superfamily ATPase